MTTPKDWYDPRHFAFMLEHKWQDQERRAADGDTTARIKLTADLQELANNILRSRRYSLFLDYYTSYQATRGAKFLNLFYDVYSELYRKLCQPKHKLLMGVHKEIPLWADTPAVAWLTPELTFGKSNEEMEKLKFQSRLFWNTAVALAINLLPMLTGQAPQAEYDRLLVPRPDRFFSQKTSRAAIEDFNERLGHTLGFPDPVEPDEVLQIQAQAMLEQRYKLVEQRPVVIRMEENPAVREVILMQKGTVLLARVETYRFGDLVQLFDLTDPDRQDSMLQTLAALTNTPPETLHALPALVASIYRDLVTVDEVTAVTRFNSGKSTKRKKGEEEPDKPKTYTTAWQIIPRRLYSNRKNDADILVERAELNAEEQGFRRALRRYHAVCGHVRRYRDKPDWMASGDRQDLAVADGIILRAGETYVKPHNRGLSALEELGEVDLALVPHYLRRGRK